jgi:ribosomal protein L3 glutamine methyltransferase
MQLLFLFEKHKITLSIYLIKDNSMNMQTSTNEIKANEAQSELFTVRDFVRWGVSQFNFANIYYGHGTDNAWDEAVFLVLHALHLPQNIDRSVLDAKLTTSEKQTVIELLWRRVMERIPAAYLTNEAWFCNMPFYVDDRVLIPRSPMTELIEKHFAPWIKPEKVRRILDMCTGSGCIAIACAFAFPEARVDALDISSEALEVAKINVDRYGLSRRVHLVQSDMFSALSDEKYDIIISNPPYVSLAEIQELPPEHHYEPRLALAAGEDGLKFVDDILKVAPKHLTEHGILVVEVGNAHTLMKKYPQIPFIWLEFERGDGESEVFLLNNY